MLSAAQANRHYFHQAYRTGQHGWDVTKPSPYALRLLRLIKRQVPGGRLLDIGCGEGRHSIAAAKLGLKPTGIDFEPLALVRARRFAKAALGAKARAIVFRRASVLALPFADASFDVVLDYGCLHHQRAADWPVYRANVLRVLRPLGFYILSVFTRDFSLFHGSRRQWHIAQGSYRRYFTRKDLAVLLGRHFEFVETEEEPRGFWHILMRRRER